MTEKSRARLRAPQALLETSVLCPQSAADGDLCSKASLLLIDGVMADWKHTKLDA
jgi:hypothetical protein